MKKLFVTSLCALGMIASASAQTNLQTFYDFGRGHFTTTLEGFHADSWGDTFFFIDYDYAANPGVSGSYMEIARNINLWKTSKLGALSAHVEFNGGVGFGNSNFLFGPSYFMHSADFSNTLTVSLLLKTFNGSAGSDLPLQLTVVWGMNNILGVQGLNFSGFADLWGENTKEGKFVFLSEPQLWYNVGQHFGVKNLNVGGEVELGYNFAGRSGFHCLPCLGTKWVF